WISCRMTFVELPLPQRFDAGESAVTCATAATMAEVVRCSQQDVRCPIGHRRLVLLLIAQPDLFSVELAPGSVFDTLPTPLPVVLQGIVNSLSVGALIVRDRG